MRLQCDVATVDIQAPLASGDPAGLATAVVAENEVLRRGVDGLLASIPEVATVHDCAHLNELERLLRRQRVDIVIVAAADAAWLDSVHDVLAQAGASVLILADPVSMDALSNVPSAATAGFLWQPSLSLSALRDALRRCQQGDAPMPPDLVRALLGRSDAPNRRVRARSASLTGRERETLTLLVRGLSNKQIAKRLSISSHGAKRLVASIMLKLDAPNRTMAAVTAIRAGIVDEQ